MMTDTPTPKNDFVPQDPLADTYNLPDEDVRLALQRAADLHHTEDAESTYAISQEDIASAMASSTQETKERNPKSGVFEKNMILRIEIEGLSKPILVMPQNEAIIGRRDPSTGDAPAIDLTPFAAYRMGVSRHHAAIQLHERRLDVRDLGSCNGTFLNGIRLNAHHPYQVRNGDEIRVGQMVLRVFFQVQNPD